MDDYDIRPVETDDASIARVASLLTTVFPDAAHLTSDVLRWQYRDNPWGAVVGFNAWAGDELAAHYATLPMEAYVGSAVRRGLLSLNTATAPAHQGKGLFSRLAAATYDRGAEQGCSFVIGVANASSTPGFTGRLGFQLVAPLRAMVGVGPLPRRTGVGALHFETAWTDEALAWRLAHPARRYRVATERDQHLVVSSQRQFGATYLLGLVPGDLVVDAGGRAPLLKLWMGLDPGLRWPPHPYVNVPARLRPAPLNLIFRDLDDGARRLDGSRVRFQALDFDVI